MSDEAKDAPTLPGTPPERLPSAPRVRDVRVGDVIADKYRVTRELGRGGMGLVVAATHLALNETVALKFLTPGTEEDGPEAHSRFLREARITAKLRSPHVARTLDFGQLDDGTQYMVMECLEGTDLGQLLARGEPIPIETAVDWVVQACDGLAEAHGLGAVHRDLKPSNLFLTTGLDGAPLVKVLDFGVSKATRLGEDTSEEQLTAAGMLLGSTRYMSPEQLQDAPTVDARSDVWALGVILYELLTGQPPFKGASPAITCALILGQDPPVRPSLRRPEISSALDAVVLRALTRDPAARTPSVGVLAEELAAAMGHSARTPRPERSGVVSFAPPAHESTQGIEVARSTPRSSWRLATILAATLVAGAAITMVVSRDRSAPREHPMSPSAAVQAPGGGARAPEAAPAPTSSATPDAATAAPASASASASSGRAPEPPGATTPTRRPSPTKPPPATPTKQKPILEERL